jgi:Mn-dependent DtxR family transcriptional regulator
MDDAPELSDTEASVLRAVHAEGKADFYALAQMVGTGPRTVQEAVRGLARKDLVIVSDRGSTVHCTPSGEDRARAGQRP